MWSVKRKSGLKRVSIVFLVIAALLGLFASCSEEDSHTNEIQAPLSAEACRHEHYEDILDKFEAAGFTNVETEPIDDLVFGWFTSDGEVDSVSINGDDGFDEGDWFRPNAAVLIRYHTFPDGEADSEVTDPTPSEDDGDKPNQEPVPSESTPPSAEPEDDQKPEENSGVSTPP